jgi:putative glutamine amidotransferase
MVNSIHHQGIKDLAPGLSATAFADDGLVEGVELPDHPFGIAVQWHPEWLAADPDGSSLFKAFVIAAAS